ncbi:MAG: adenine phosphoribosyltransferase [Candidatus Paceibacterota bacterium]
MKIALLSKSEIKFNALNNIFNTFKDYSITCIEGNDKTDQIEQPIGWNGGYGAARNRFMVLYKENPSFYYDYNLIVIMENYMESDGTDYVVIIFFDVFYELEFCLNHPCVHIKDYDGYFALFIQEVYQNQTHKWGSHVTFGSLLNKQNSSIPEKDWMSVIMGKPRQVALEEGLSKMMDIYVESISMKEEIVNEGFTSHRDFPKPGVIFKDWSNIFVDPNLLHNLINMTTRIFDHRNMFYKTKDRFLSYQDYDYDQPDDDDDNEDNDDQKDVKKFSHQIDYVVGLESRGLWLAAPLAMHLDCGMIPARKPGKIPGKILSETYQKEYGTDTLEIRNDVPPGNVLIVDDILATGGSLMAAIRLVERAGHKVIGCAVVSDVPELREIAKNTLGSYPVHVLLKEK